MIRSIVWAFATALTLMLSGVAEAQEGDASDGVLIYSVGSVDIAMSFRFQYRRTALASGEAVSDTEREMVCNCVGLWRPRPNNLDYYGREAGRVFVQQLPPGRYEIYDFGFSGTLVVANVDWSSSSPFSIPFTVTPGEATYIGNFARAPSLGTSLQPSLGAAGYFVVSDQSERDLPIAQTKMQDLPPVRIEVTDVAPLGHPAIFSSVQE